MSGRGSTIITVVYMKGFPRIFFRTNASGLRMPARLSDKYVAQAGQSFVGRV